MSPPPVKPFFIVTTADGWECGSYTTRQGVGTKLRFTHAGRAFHWAPETGLVEVTETFWWGCFNTDGWEWKNGVSQQVERQVHGRIYRGRR